MIVRVVLKDYEIGIPSIAHHNINMSINSHCICRHLVKNCLLRKKIQLCLRTDSVSNLTVKKIKCALLRATISSRRDCTLATMFSQNWKQDCYLEVLHRV